ncbi:MAG: hypothetical protein WBP58_17515 [Chitinophagaceae bacterium]
MWDPTQSVMYLASRRDTEETVDHRISKSLAEPAHGVEAWDDVVLAPDKMVYRRFEKEVLMFIMPMVGEVDYEDETGQLFSVAAGQLLLIPLAAGVQASVRNVYQDALVNCLISAVVTAQRPALKAPELLPVNLQQFNDVLGSLNNLYLPLYIGNFQGRSEASLFTKEHRLFVFVIEGAFEVQHRLLEYRDGMLLWNTTQVELEALSNDAKLLILDLGKP